MKRCREEEAAARPLPTPVRSLDSQTAGPEDETIPAIYDPCHLIFHIKPCGYAMLNTPCDCEIYNMWFAVEAKDDGVLVCPAEPASGDVANGDGCAPSEKDLMSVIVLYSKFNPRSF